MNNKRIHIASYSLRILLLVFWLYVAMDKLWDLSAFHVALLRQPLPELWSDILFIALPLIELGLSLLFVFSSKRYPFLLSTVLMLLFTLYIGLGVAGLYSEQPCGCASAFSSLSWSQHLMVNIVLFALSILGWYLTGPTAPIEPVHSDYSRSIGMTIPLIVLSMGRNYRLVPIIRIRFPRRFALFPGWAGVVLNYDTCAYPVQSIAEAKDR